MWKLICIWLCIISYEDWKTRLVSVKWLCIGGILIIVDIIIHLNVSIDVIMIFSRVMGMTCGSIFLLVSRLSDQRLGYGDSILMTMLGGYVGLDTFITMMFIAFGLCFVMGKMAMRYRGWDSIPMIPFITVGYILGGVVV